MPPSYLELLEAEELPINHFTWKNREKKGVFCGSIGSVVARGRVKRIIEAGRVEGFLTTVHTALTRLEMYVSYTGRFEYLSRGFG